MSELCSKFQSSASHTVGGVVKTRAVLLCDMVKICVPFSKA